MVLIKPDGFTQFGFFAGMGDTALVKGICQFFFSF
jgi:hypothetical protein